MTDQGTSGLSGDEEGLRNLLVRLQAQSLRPDFQVQREIAIGLVLKPYLDPITAQYLAPWPEEIEMAEEYLYADYFPTDGHPSLIEQVRDTITEHIPEEERIWLDPVRHSYIDMLQILEFNQENQPYRLILQSLGDQQQFDVSYSEKTVVQKDRVLLTRLIRGPSSTYLPSHPLVLSSAMAETLLTFTHELRRGIEFSTGNFALAEWPEFTKQYGYLLIWSLARIRGGALATADAQVPYWNERGEPFFYAIALYEHHEFEKLTQSLSDWEQLKPLPPLTTSQHGETSSKKVWLQYAQNEQSTSQSVARLTLTQTQLILETISASQLDSLKHQLAATFGFSLHFKGETTTPPPHSLPHVDLLADTYVAPPVTVSVKEENKLLATLLENVYLEWAEQPCPALNGKTPRQYCRETQDTTKVAELIDQMEQHDLGLQRTGQRGYDYTILRAHIGL